MATAANAAGTFYREPHHAYNRSIKGLEKNHKYPRRGGHNMDQKFIIDPRDSRATIAALDKAFKAAVEGRLDVLEEQASLDARRQELNELEQELADRADDLQAQRQWWKEELARAPDEPPAESLQKAIDGMLAQDASLTRDQIMERLNPRYFPDGVNQKARQKVAMHKRWALERLGKR